MKTPYQISGARCYGSALGFDSISQQLPGAENRGGLRFSRTSMHGVQGAEIKEPNEMGIGSENRLLGLSGTGKVRHVGTSSTPLFCCAG